LQGLVQVFVPHGPILLGLDDTVERRRGKKITAKGIYRTLPASVFDFRLIPPFC